MLHSYSVGARSGLFTVLRPARVVGALLLALAHWLPLAGLAQGQRPGARPGTVPPGGEVELRLAAGTYRLAAGAKAPVAPAEVVAGRYYRLVQFSRLPTDAQRAALAADGRVELLAYLPQNAWLAAVRAGTDPAAALRGLAVRAIVAVAPEWKLSSSLASRNYPSHALRGSGRLALRVLPYAPVALAAAARRLRALGAVVAEKSEYPGMLDVTVAVGEERRLAAEPWVQSVEAAPAAPVLEGERDVTSHRANVLNSNLPSGRHLDGAGVTVAIGDDGAVGPHIDFQGRLTNAVASNNGNHADHVTGIVGGAGNLNPTVRGQATGAALRTYSYYDDISGMTGAGGLYTTQSVRISSHSLGQTCNDGYTSDARTSDQHIRQNPALMYVHSAGNSGTGDCSYGAGAGWGTITGGFKMGKNVLAVGNITHLDVLAPSSSRGPAKDGRIKPDICASGTDVTSNGENNTFNTFTGTSMACPSVSGVLAQLYQAYRNAHAGADPSSALIKAAVLNTADDLGNAGPDFKHGYGRINALRAVELLENTRYVTNTLSTGQTQTVSLTVPAGASQLKVMLYWADYEAAANAATALVNDLDLTLSTPAAGTLQPWVLNPAPNATTLDAPATRGTDRLNNVEQVTLDAPAAGTYTATISGFGIPQGPQAYYVVYSWVEDNVRLTSPIGGEAFVPGEAQVLRWDASTTATGFTLEYSTNGGTAWNSIGTAAAALRAFTWTVPASLGTTPSGQVRVRVVRGAQASSSENLTAAGVPANLRVESVCSTETRLNWNAVPGATGYEIFQLGTSTMESVGTTTGLAFTVTGVAASAEQWFSVRATGAGGLVGRRANALRRGIGNSNCPGFPAPAITSFTPTSGPAGTGVTLTGTDFTGATAVSFFGTAASTFTVVSATTITVNAPVGSVTGPITVITPNGQATSTQSFTPTDTYLLNNNLPVTTCSGTLYDSGGPGSSYATSENFTKTFSPATAGARLRLVFTAFNTETAYDFLYIYDGADASAPLIGRYEGTVGPGTVTATNAAGQLTLRFTSDASDVRPGFAATISCLSPPAPTLTSLSPASGPVGTSVTLTGTNFTGATGVRFNGTAATVFGVASATTATATVPTGTTSGNVTITTPGGISNGVAFTVCAVTALARNVSVALDAGGNATVAAAQVNNGSSSTCGAVTLSVSPSAFTCANVGANAVTLTVTDGFGGSSTATATVTVSVPPTPTTTWTGSASTAWTDCANWSFGKVPDAATNVVIPGSLARYPALSAGTLAVQDVTLNAGGLLTVASGTTLQVNGNFASSGTATLNGTVAFVGSAATQTLSYGGGFTTVVVNKPSGAVQLGQNLTINAALTLTSGALATTGSYQVNLGGSATLSESETSYVVGKVVVNRPLAPGTAQSFGGLGLTLTPAAGSTAPGATLVSRTTGTALTGAGSSASVLRSFDIQPAVDQGLDVAMVFAYFGHELNGIAEANLALFKSVSGAAGPWANQRPVTLDAAANTVSKAGIPSFSVWTLGNALAPLPVELTAFTAAAEGNRAVRLAWATASEKNSLAFDVERGPDGRAFAAIGTVAAAGSSSAPRRYGFVDAKLPAGAALLYYRLRQVDADGSFSYSPVRVVALKGAAAGLSLYPNPATTGATLTGALPGMVATVFDALGRFVTSATTDATGTAALALPAGLPTGVYVVRAGSKAVRLTVE